MNEVATRWILRVGWLGARRCHPTWIDVEKKKTMAAGVSLETGNCKPETGELQHNTGGVRGGEATEATEATRTVVSSAGEKDRPSKLMQDAQSKAMQSEVNETWSSRRMAAHTDF